MTEKLRSFVVVMNFAPPGVLRLGSYIAPDEVSAAALCAIDAAHTMRHIDPYPPLSNCLVVEETAEMLRHRLRAIEGKPAGDVVSLVPARDADTVAAEILSNPGGQDYLNKRAAEIRARGGETPMADWEAEQMAQRRRMMDPGWRPDDPCDPVA